MKNYGLIHVKCLAQSLAQRGVGPSGDGHTFVRRLPKARRGLGAHSYSVTKKKYRHKVTVQVKQGQSMTVTVGADGPGSSHQHLHGFCLPMFVHMKGTFHVKECVCLNPKMFKERE